jgi:hypothetical protein
MFKIRPYLIFWEPSPPTIVYGHVVGWFCPLQTKLTALCCVGQWVVYPPSPYLIYFWRFLLC